MITSVTQGAWRDGKYVQWETLIVDLSNEDLLWEFYSEAECESRRLSYDPPSPIEILRAEILKRMGH